LMLFILAVSTFFSSGYSPHQQATLSATKRRCSVAQWPQPEK
jgi:hypothetical protein